ncbi:hypothetical protein KUCAC02_031272, partial [Chaenocephalus aceratus]
KRRSPLGKIDSVVGGEKKRGTAKWRRDEAWMGRERRIYRSPLIKETFALRLDGVSLCSSPLCLLRRRTKHA